MPKRVINPKIACLDMGLMKSKMKMGVQVVVTDPSQLDAIHKRYTFAVQLLDILRSSVSEFWGTDRVRSHYKNRLLHLLEICLKSLVVFFN